MKSYTVTGYTADADTYCEACTIERYGSCEAGTLDHEGNEIAVIFADSEWDYPVFCSNCKSYIYTSLTGDGERYAREVFADGPYSEIVREQYPWIFEGEVAS